MVTKVLLFVLLYVSSLFCTGVDVLDYQKDSGDAEDNNYSLKERYEPEKESLEGNTCFKHFTDMTELRERWSTYTYIH